MITLLEKDLNKKRSNSLKSFLNRYLVDKNQIKEGTKRIWFKGSRYR